MRVFLIDFLTDELTQMINPNQSIAKGNKLKMYQKIKLNKVQFSSQFSNSDFEFWNLFQKFHDFLWWPEFRVRSL